MLYDTDVVYKFYQPSSNVNEWTEAANPYLGVTRTQTDDGTTDGWIKYTFEGTINNYVESQSYDLIRVGTLRANLGMAIDSTPSVSTGPVEPDFSVYDFYFTDNQTDWSGTPPIYTAAYNHASFQVTNSSNQAYIIGTTLSYNPLDQDGYSELEEGDFCGLGHRFRIQQTSFNPDEPEEASDEITSVTFPATLPSTSAQETITVHGAVGATYSLHLQKMESTTTTKVNATSGYYSFSGGLRGFKDVIARPKTNEFTIGNSGKKSHKFILPRSSDEERYEVFVTPAGTTSARSSVPTKVGEGTIIREGITTVTIQAEAETDANWQLSAAASESDVTPVITTSFSRRKSARGQKHDSVTAKAQSAVSASTKLILERADSRIQPGMYVITPMAGDGVPYNTTVSSVKNKNVILSANCTIAQDANVLFESNTSRIVPFNLTIPAGYGDGTELIASDPADNRTFDNDTGNWAALDTTGSDVSITRDGTKLQVTTSTDNEIEGAQLPIAHVGDGSTTSIVAGKSYRVYMKLALTSGATTMATRFSIGGTVSDAFTITTSETAVEKVIVAANNTDALKVYNTSLTNCVFTVDDVSVKEVTYKNLTATNSDPNTSLGGTSSGSATVDGATTNSLSVVVDSPGQRKVVVGMLVKSDEIIGSAVVAAVNLSTRTITMRTTQTLSDGSKLTFESDPALEGTSSAVTTGGVDLLHTHATISESGSVSNQEVAQVYGYLKVNNPNNSVTLPFYLDSILTSASF